MNFSNTVFFLSMILSFPAAMAASDVTVDVSSDQFVTVYDATEYTVVVRNIGNSQAKNVSVDIQLPETHTSPTVHILGDLAYVDSRCIVTGTMMTCSLGKIGKNKDKDFNFVISYPESAEDFIVEATVSTTSNESNTSNNYDNDRATQTFYTVTVMDGDPAHIRSCTGLDLISFFECELYPSSIIAHDIKFNGDGTLTIVGQPAYTGEWKQVAPDHLKFYYSGNSIVLAEFEGYGVDVDCFEGLTTFPGGPSVAPYEVCLQ